MLETVFNTLCRWLLMLPIGIIAYTVMLLSLPFFAYIEWLLCKEQPHRSAKRELRLIYILLPLHFLKFIATGK